MDILRNAFVMLAITVLIAACDSPSTISSPGSVIQPLDLTGYSAEKSVNSNNLLFIHHSVGATLFADPGTKAGEYCLWEYHPNGGGLRKLLTQNNYNVHEATYGSELGQDTDVNHWYAKFRDQMDLALRTRLQDELLEGGEVNQVIVFKSCYPNNTIIADGSPPGDPDSPERTLWNSKAAYNSLLPIFKKYPKTLFIAVTVPPTVKPWMNKYKEKMYTFLGKGPEKIGMRARLFNNWLADTNSGWLSDYNLKNVVAFNYYDILTDGGISNWTQYPSRDGKDSHPSSKGNSIAAEKFVDFINRAVRYAGIDKDE